MNHSLTEKKLNNNVIIIIKKKRTDKKICIFKVSAEVFFGGEPVGDE